MTTVHVPRATIDLFADEVLTDPYPVYADLRERGGAVYLENLDAYALTRYDGVRDALGDWETYSSAGALALNDVVNRGLEGTLLGSDPPLHDKLRAVMMKQLSPRALRGVKDFIDQSADALVAELVERGSFDIVPDLAVALPISVVFELIGFPDEVRGDMLRWADNHFNGFGPMNERTQRALPIMKEMHDWLGKVRAEDLKPNTMGRAVFDAADEGVIEYSQCRPLIRAYTTAGMDTTITGIVNTVHLLATHPEQWDAVRADPALVPAAFNEALRYDAPVQLFSRKVMKDTVVDGTPLEAGSRVILLFGSGNRDDRHYDDPDRFDVSRNPVDHLSFGYGTHSCGGQALAKLEAHAIVNALARRVRRFQVGEPVRHLNNVVRGLESVPVTSIETISD